MKLYKRFKGMKKSTKIGLATSAVYAASAFALPVFANTVDKPEPVVVQPINLEGVNTVEQADNVYNEKLIEYSTDKLLTFPELENLYKIQRVKNNILVKKGNNLRAEHYEKTSVGIQKINAEINKLNQKLESEELEEIEPLVKTREKLEEKILAYYPTLIEKEKGNITYSAETMLEQDLITPFRDIVSEADKILQEHYKDDLLELLIKKENYSLKDVFVVYDLVTKERKNADLDRQKGELKKKITLLVEERDKITRSQQEGSYWPQEFGYKLNRSSELTGRFKYYLDTKKDAEEFEAKYGNFNNQCAISILKHYLLEKKGLEASFELPLTQAYSRIKTAQETSLQRLETYLSNEGLEFEIEKFKNPAEKKFPTWLGAFVLGFGIPIVRNILVKAYLQGSGAIAEEYFLTSLMGLGNGMMGGLLLDGLHPFVFPARMLTPLLFQPIFSYFKIDPCETIATNM